MLKLLAELKHKGYLSNLVFYQAELIANKLDLTADSMLNKNIVILASALVSHAYLHGHSCIILPALDDYFGLKAKYASEGRQYLQKINDLIENIPATKWYAKIKQSVAVTNESGVVAPLMFWQDLLYAYRFFMDEQKIANYLLAKCKAKIELNAEQKVLISELIPQLFPTQTKFKIDWQQVVVASSLMQKFTLISGGPGTGKTTTVIKILLALQAIADKPLHIQLAAPTGKATARLMEAVSHGLHNFQHLEVTKKFTLEPAKTLHRLLKINSTLRPSQYNNLVDLDVLIVDEVSMLDLNLMTSLVNQVPATTHLIMLGDKDQLAAVESGAIMAELTDFPLNQYSQTHLEYLQQLLAIDLPVATQTNLFTDHLYLLEHSYRFNHTSKLGQLAQQVNQQQADVAWQLLSSTDQQSSITVDNNVQLVDYKHLAEHTWQQQIVAIVIAGYRAYLQALYTKGAQDFLQINKLFNQFRLLVAVRESEFGVIQLNQMIETALQQNALLNKGNLNHWYLGKPIMITQNDYENGLANGDIGIVTQLEPNNIKVSFVLQANQVKIISANKLKHYETAYCMTVHKSQGSEFEHVALVLPQQPMPILSKELIYTAVTRAKTNFTIITDEITFKDAVAKKVQRNSGLNRQLRQLL